MSEASYLVVNACITANRYFRSLLLHSRCMRTSLQTTNFDLISDLSLWMTALLRARHLKLSQLSSQLCNVRHINTYSTTHRMMHFRAIVRILAASTRWACIVATRHSIKAWHSATLSCDCCIDSKASISSRALRRRPSRSDNSCLHFIKILCCTSRRVYLCIHRSNLLRRVCVRRPSQLLLNVSRSQNVCSRATAASRTSWLLEVNSFQARIDVLVTTVSCRCSLRWISLQLQQ
jgi:hypothetical protein